jgi:cation:H+ antiporter
MPGLLPDVLLFLGGAAAIWTGGSRLPKSGEALAARLGISTTAVGLFVLSIVTSLPELSVTLAAMLGEDAPNLAFGNIFGSNNFNATSIAILELMAIGVFLHNVDSTRYARTCRNLLVLTLIAGLGVLFAPMMSLPALPVLLFSVPIIAVFVLDAFYHGRRSRGKPREREKTAGHSAWVFVRFALLSVLVVAGGFAIAKGANGIASHEFGGGFQLGETFVGTLLVAVATSMPEVSVAYAAIKRARLEDMALGTLLGSNTVNVLVFAVGAPLYLLKSQQSAWWHLDVSNLVSVVTALILTLFVLVGITSRSHRAGRATTRALVALMVPIYLVCLLLVYRMA